MLQELHEFLFVSFPEARKDARKEAFRPGVGPEAKWLHDLDRHMAQDEHKTYRHVPLFASLDEIGRLIGPNIRYLSMFGFIILAVNLFMALCALGFMAVYLYYLTQSDDVSVLDVLSVSNPMLWLSITRMTSSAEPYWYGFIALNLFVSFFYPWMYRHWLKVWDDRTDESSARFDRSIPDDPWRGQLGNSYGTALDEIIHPKSRYQPKANTSNLMQEGTTIRAILPPTAESVEMHVVDDGDGMYVAEPSIIPGKYLREYGMDPITASQMATEIEQRKWERFIGRLGSAGVFFGLLVLNAAMNYFVYAYSHSQNQLLVSVALSLMLSVFNVIWERLARLVTTWECHSQWGEFYKSYFLKCFLFRTFSITILFCISRLTIFGFSGLNPLNSDNYSSDILPTQVQCPFDSLAQLYATTVFTEILGSLWSSVVLTWAQKCVAEKCRPYDEHSSDTHLSDFILAQAYTNLLSKQFLVLMGSSIFPLMSMGMAVAVLADLILDRVKLKYFSKRVAVTSNSFKTLLVALNTFNIVIAVFMPPSGVLFTIIGFNTNCADSIVF